MASFWDSEWILVGAAALRKNEEVIMPLLQEDTQDLPNIVQVGHHPIPRLRTAADENGDPPINEHLLESEQRLVEAVREVDGAEAVPSNSVSAVHFWRIVMSLRDKLLRGGLHEIRHREAYALILLRLVDRLILCPVHQDREYIPYPTFVPYSRPRDDVECLGLLAGDMAEGLVRMQLTGVEDDIVYISKNLEIHIESLSSLASRLFGV